MNIRFFFFSFKSVHLIAEGLDFLFKLGNINQS